MYEKRTKQKGFRAELAIPQTSIRLATLLAALKTLCSVRMWCLSGLLSAARFPNAAARRFASKLRSAWLSVGGQQRGRPVAVRVSAVMRITITDVANNAPVQFRGCVSLRTSVWDLDCLQYNLAPRPCLEAVLNTVAKVVKTFGRHRSEVVTTFGLHPTP